MAGTHVGALSVTLDTTPRTDTGALVAKPVSQVPAAHFNISSIFASMEEEVKEEEDQPTDELMPWNISPVPTAGGKDQTPAPEV